MVVSPLSTESIEWPPTGPPSEAYPLGAPSLPLSRPKHLPLPPSLPKSATLQPTGTQGESRSIRGIGVPLPPVSRQSDTVSVLRTHSPTMVREVRHLPESNGTGRIILKWIGGETPQEFIGRHASNDVK